MTVSAVACAALGGNATSTLPPAGSANVVHVSTEMDAAGLYNRAQVKFAAHDAAGGLADLKSMLAMTSSDADALALQAIWSEQIEDAAARDAALSRLSDINPAAALTARNVIDGVNAAAQIVPSTQTVAAPSSPTAIVILGYGLRDDGTMAAELVNRLQAGLRQAHATPDIPVFVTGGVPKRGITEAAAMKAWLLVHGVAESRITTEDRSTSTVTNAQYTTELLRQRGIAEAILVTSPSHIRRAAANFASAGTRVTGAVTTATDLDKYLTPYTREQQAGIRLEATRAAGIPVTKTGSAQPDPGGGALPGAADFAGLSDVVGRFLDLIMESSGSLSAQ
nr:YdcF family protein [Hoyosella subflava]